MTHHARFVLGAFSFSFGFFGYLAIETVYKGLISHAPTHWTMGALAGASCLFLLWIDRKEMLFFMKAFFGALFVTAFEFLLGLWLNVYRGLGIWDYRDLPFHLLGQIAPLFSLCWLFLCSFILLFNRFLKREVIFLFGID